MADRTLPLASTASAALGAVALAAAFLFTYSNYGPPASQFSGPSTGLAIFVIWPTAVLGGVLIAHAVYRFSSRGGRSAWWLLAYPVATGVPIVLVGAYVRIGNRFVSWGSLLDLVVSALVAGGIAGGFVWFVDRVRDHLPPDAG